MTVTHLDPHQVAKVARQVHSRDRDATLELVKGWHPADLAMLLPRLGADEALTLFGWLPEERASEVLPELEEEYRTALLEEVEPANISALVDDLSVDDAADVLADLPDDVVQEVLPQLEDAAAVEGVLAYDEETAGGLMDTKLVSVLDTATVNEATEEVRRCAETVDPVYVIYVIDEESRLQGLLRLSRLLLAPADAPVRSIMRSDVIAVEPATDQEEVARIMERYDVVALPVVDAEGHLLGRITIDDVVDVIREEAEEDIQRMSGVGGAEEINDSVLKTTGGRLSWLFLGLGGALFSALVINRFEVTLERAVVLAMFIPVVMAMAGNAGIQSSAIAVQGLASGDLWSSDVGRRLRKELVVALLNGFSLAVVLGVAVLAFEHLGLLNISPEDGPRLALTVSLTLVTVIALAATTGATVPLLLDRFRLDPALASGPFITTSNDILGLLVYFVIASTLYLP